MLAIDQSGSMASSVVYASVFGAVLASVRALWTSLVVFDTAVADLTPLLSDPVDVLFGTQLGGGNAAALASLGIPAFACMPDAFPDLLAQAINGGDIAAWAQREGLAAR